MSSDRHPLKHQIKIYGPAALLVVAAFVLAYQFIRPAPPDHVIMVTGNTEGAYHAFAQRYAAYFAKQGIELELIPTAGSVENIGLLRQGEAQVGLVQGGIEGPTQQLATPVLESLGSTYYEPLWLFRSKDVPFTDLRDLDGLRVAVGLPGSGTRALAEQLLDDNRVVTKDLWVHKGGQDAIDALLGGDVDAVFLVISAQSPLIEMLLRHPDFVPTDFVRASAYERRYHFLSSLILPQGAVDLAADIPARPIRLLAPAANLVVREDLHPAIKSLLLQAADESHQAGGWFEGPGKFPKPDLLAYPLSEEAERFYEHGPPFLQRFMPFWAASLVDRLKVMLLPLLVLLFPLFKVMPPIYSWRMRARIYRWYGELEQAELDLASTSSDTERVSAELDRIEAEVQRVNVPLSFTDKLYHLRQHIDLVRRRMGKGRVGG